MSVIVTRNGKGSPLTFNEADANFTNLNNDKYEENDSPTFNVITGTSYVGLPVFDGTNDGIVPAGSNTGTQFLRDDGVFAVAGGVTPGGPLYAVQFNNPVDTFDGSAELLADVSTSALFIGDSLSWLVSPKPKSVGSNAQGNHLTITAGTGDGTARGGDLILKSGLQGNAATVFNRVIIQGSDAINSVTQGDQVVITGGAGGTFAIGGQVTMSGGTGLGGGDASVFAGSGVASGGNAYLSAGNASNLGGFVNIRGGDSSVQLTGGQVEIYGGQGTSSRGHLDLIIGELRLAGSAGAAGQVLMSSGSGTPPVWGTAGSQAGIQFKDEGVNLGTANTVNAVDFVGNGVSATRSVDTVTVSISSGGVPWFVPSGTTQTINEFDQALFYLPIEIEGTFEVFGFLTEVTA